MSLNNTKHQRPRDSESLRLPIIFLLRILPLILRPRLRLLIPRPLRPKILLRLMRLLLNSTSTMSSSNPASSTTSSSTTPSSYAKSPSTTSTTSSSLASSQILFDYDDPRRTFSYTKSPSLRRKVVRPRRFLSYHVFSTYSSSYPTTSSTKDSSWVNTSSSASTSTTSSSNTSSTTSSWPLLLMRSLHLRLDDVL